MELKMALCRRVSLLNCMLCSSFFLKLQVVHEQESPRVVPHSNGSLSNILEEEANLRPEVVLNCVQEFRLHVVNF